MAGQVVKIKHANNFSIYNVCISKEQSGSYGEAVFSPDLVRERGSMNMIVFTIHFLHLADYYDCTRDSYGNSRYCHYKG